MLINDSSAILYEGRVLAQHQAALGLVRQLTQDPSISEIRWLDLACGRGQILSSLETVISEQGRSKVQYVGFDVSRTYAMQTRNRAEQLFKDVRIEICELQNFEQFLAQDDSFQIITFTNTAHEIDPRELAKTLVGAVCRTTPDGCLFAYDMETLPVLELGAIPWRGAEIERVFTAMLLAAGVRPDAIPEVAVWPHRSCTCWNLQIHRAHLQIHPLSDRRDEMVAEATREIENCLEDKLYEVHTALNAASRYGCETDDEQEEVQRLVYDYWAISRALGRAVETAVDMVELDS